MTPTGLITGESHHGCWGGKPWKIPGSSTEYRFCDDLDGYFRNVTPAHDVVELRHKGWYIDHHQDETCHGLVMQLPGRNIWLYGVNDPWNNNAGVVAWRKYEWADNKEDAARWADDAARHYAEYLREDAIKQEAQWRIEETRNEIVDLREEARLLIAGIRKSTLAPAICERMRKDIRSLRRDIHKAFKNIAELEDNPYVVVQ